MSPLFFRGFLESGDVLHAMEMFCLGWGWGKQPEHCTVGGQLGGDEQRGTCRSLLALGMLWGYRSPSPSLAGRTVCALSERCKPSGAAQCVQGQDPRGAVGVSLSPEPWPPQLQCSQPGPELLGAAKMGSHLACVSPRLAPSAPAPSRAPPSLALASKWQRSIALRHRRASHPNYCRSSALR